MILLEKLLKTGFELEITGVWDEVLSINCVTDSVTKLGDLLLFGQFLKPLATINLPKTPTFLGNFCKGVKIYHFSCEIIFGQLLLSFDDFFLVTLVKDHSSINSLGYFFPRSGHTDLYRKRGVRRLLHHDVRVLTSSVFISASLASSGTTTLTEIEEVMVPFSVAGVSAPEIVKNKKNLFCRNFCQVRRQCEQIGLLFRGLCVKFFLQK